VRFRLVHPGTRVDGWRNGITDMVNLLGAIPSADRKPEQATLLAAATQGKR